MLRVTTAPRAGWQKIVEAQGLTFHTLGGEPYWDESAYYLFEASEIDAIEAATTELDSMCLQAVEHVLDQDRLAEFDIPEAFRPFVRESWDRDEHTIYGRFDLSYDGQGPPKLLEYNADTPTSLLEAAVIQWSWSKDLVAAQGPVDRPQIDQFNSIHERLIEAWGRVRRELGRRVAFSVMDDSLEDLMTVTYLRDTATQAGIDTQSLAMGDLGWDAARHAFTDLRERPLDLIFKLYPWEWMVREEFGRHLTTAPTLAGTPLEMVLSNKAILPVLYELFPASPYLLRAGFEPFGDTYVMKPAYSREGANVSIVVDGETVAETGGEYADGPHIYQEFHPLPSFEGHRPVIGSWIVNGNACGIGIREDDGPITRNTSRFLPHVFRKSAGMEPPAMPAAPGDRDDPPRDRGLDR